MLIQNKEQDNRGTFFIQADDEKLAELDYTLSPGIMVINHTEVNEKLKGQNIGYQIVDHAAVYAREKHLKISPVCPFARAVFEKKKDAYSDVVKL